MRKQTILHVINIPSYNAGAWYGVSTAFAQMQAGHRVIIAGDSGSPSLEEARRLGIPETVRLPLSAGNPLLAFESFLKLKALIEKEKVTVVNGHQGTGYFLSALAGRWARNRPIVVRTRADIGWPKQHFLNEWLHTRCTDGVISASQVVCDRLLGSFSILPSRTATIPPGVDVQRFYPRDADLPLRRQKAGLSPDIPVFGLLGRLDPVKGHTLVFEALKNLRDSGTDIQLVVAGKEAGLSFESLKAVCQTMGISDRVHFFGILKDVRDMIMLCDAGIIASTDSEAVCRVALEFFGMGVPIIASRLHGIPDVVHHEKTGLLFSTGDSAALAEAIRRFLSETELARTLKAAVRPAAEHLFSLELLGKRSLSFYDDLMHKRVRR